MERDRRNDHGAKEMPEVRDIEQEVRERAYQRFLARTGAGDEGDELSDWIAAEAEVRGERRVSGS